MSSDDESDVDVKKLPSAKECQERCENFALVTGTDTALAMFYLQDREWDLDHALNDYFEQAKKASVTVDKLTTLFEAKRQDKKVSTKIKSDSASAPSAKANDISSGIRQTGSVADPPHRIRLISWNIDGLDTNNLKTRTAGVCDMIKRENPHVVYLQEVVPVSLELLESLCPEYMTIPSGNDGYFTAMMLKAGSVVYDDHDVKRFYSSRMMRNLLSVKCSVNDVQCCLMTSHLESTATHAEERKRQLTKCFKEMKDADFDRSVIFGGDLNMRDKELAELGGIPDGIFDLWEVTGKRPECKFTWDTVRNDNCSNPAGGKFKPRCRFDRLYLRHGQPKAKLKPVYFEIIGLEKLSKCQRFPSDHWGLLAHFDITDKVKK